MDLFKYIHLANPVSGFFRSGSKPGDAPVGRLRLAENDKLNYALWNTIGSAAWMVPAALIISRLSNKGEHDKVKAKMATMLKSRLSASRPTLATTADTSDDVKALLTDAVDKQIEKEMAKTAAEGEKTALDEFLDAGKAFFSSLGSAGKEGAAGLAKDMLTKGTAVALPIAVPSVLALLAAKKHNEAMKGEIEEALLADRDALKEEQRAVDRATMSLQGLIKGASGKTEAAEQSLQHTILMPLTLATLLAAGSGILGYRYFSRTDKASAKLKALRERLLGVNHLQDAPKLTMAELPVALSEITATPGSVRKETVALANPVTGALEDKKIKKLDNIIDVEDVLEEVSQEKPKKDAIF